MQRVKALLVEPGKPPEEIRINPMLYDVQLLLGGYAGMKVFPTDAACVLYRMDGRGDPCRSYHGQYIYGPCVIMGYRGLMIGGLNRDQLERYKREWGDAVVQ